MTVMALKRFLTGPIPSRTIQLGQNAPVIFLFKPLMVKGLYTKSETRPLQTFSLVSVSLFRFRQTWLLSSTSWPPDFSRLGRGHAKPPGPKGGPSHAESE